MKGVWFSSKLTNVCELRDVEKPIPGEDEILVKNVVAAANPKDWMMPSYMPDRHVIEGSDLAGYVESLGVKVEGFSVGDRVAAFTKMGGDSKYGAYAEYTVAPASTTFRLGDATRFEDAVTVPLTGMTAALALFVHLGLKEPPMDGRGTASGTIIVNSASGSVGSFAVQLAILAGYTVIAVAGNGADLAKDVGAEVVIDYRGKSTADLAQEINDAVAASGTPLVGIFDANSSDSTVLLLANHIPAIRGGKIALVNPPPASGVRDDITTIFTYVGSAHGDNAEFAAKVYPLLGKWLDAGLLKPNRVRIMPNGLQSVQEGVLLLRDKKVSGEKLVFRIADTPGI